MPLELKMREQPPPLMTTIYVWGVHSNAYGKLFWVKILGWQEFTSMAPHRGRHAVQHSQLPARVDNKADGFQGLLA